MHKCFVFLFHLDKKYVMQASFSLQGCFKNVDLMNCMIIINFFIRFQVKDC
jgi:hypothetical protein